MNADKAGGILASSLEMLAMHYGMVDLKKLTAIAQELAFGRGVKAVLEFVEVFATSAKGFDKDVLSKLTHGLQKRFSRQA